MSALLAVGLVLTGAGCAAPAATARAGGEPDDTATPRGASIAAGGETLAFVDGEAITLAELRPALIEAAGGQVLSETVLDRLPRRRLAEQGITLAREELEAEERLLTATLHPDPDQAQRLLNELRGRRGLGPQRYRRLLFRNAALRRLVRDEVQVPESAVREMYEYEHGPRYEARLIVVDSHSEADRVVRQARAGESFIDLALEASTDVSRSRGGLLEPISPVDPTYPAEVRSVLASLEPGQVSDPVALERGFAVLKLERKTEPAGVEFADVREEMALRVRRQAERTAMERLARTLLEQAQVQVLDPSLQESWSRHRRRMTPEE